ncbi:MAG: hypothetical protein IPO80_13360 [Propionibacteriaceae bacterium]|nr:hypothetical protein [Propionibacteriaceae bacterium]
MTDFKARAARFEAERFPLADAAFAAGQGRRGQIAEYGATWVVRRKDAS